MADIYPSWRYKTGESPRIVHSPDDEKALGKGWQDTPTEDHDTRSKPVLDKAVEQIRKEADEATKAAEEAALKIARQPRAGDAAELLLRSSGEGPMDESTAEEDEAYAKAHDEAEQKLAELKASREDESKDHKRDRDRDDRPHASQLPVKPRDDDRDERPHATPIPARKK